MARRVASTRDLRLQHGLSFKYLKQKWLLVKIRPATLLSSRSVGPEWNMSLVDRLRLAIGYWNLLIGFALAATVDVIPPPVGWERLRTPLWYRKLRGGQPAARPRADQGCLLTDLVTACWQGGFLGT